MRSADDLLDEAAAAPTEGWDFSWIADRTRVVPTPWDFTATATAALERASRALDMGTGGGEWLSAFGRLPALTIATESWRPNVGVAARRLAGRGVPVVCDEGATDNVPQRDQDARGRMPFRSASFDLLLNRHESFAAPEVARVLHSGGRFLTQQADSSIERFHELLELSPPNAELFQLELAVAQVEGAGLVVEEAATGFDQTIFTDIGAFAWYLRMIPWAVPGFRVDDHRDVLARLHGTEISVRAPRFWLLARKRVTDA